MIGRANAPIRSVSSRYVGWMVTSLSQARLLRNCCSHTIRIWKKILKKLFYCKKLKYTIIYGLCHISIKTVRSPSCAGLIEPAASWRTLFDNGVGKMVIVMKLFQCCRKVMFCYEVGTHLMLQFFLVIKIEQKPYFSRSRLWWMG